MALIVINKDEWENIVRKNVIVRNFDDEKGVQHEFCKLLEIAKHRDERTIFEEPDVKNYLKEMGITYKGNYLVHSDDWGRPGGHPSDEFVTYITYSVQLTCIVLHYKANDRMNIPITIRFPYLLDKKHSRYMLSKYDIYLVVDTLMDMTCSFGILYEMNEAGIEIKIDGKSSHDMSPDEFEVLLEDIYKRNESSYIGGGSINDY